ncbi:spore germination protein [Pullulanibacillus sp. KACC 23026]|uniref:spore germination protein n=1 Tax=Pullulanibacillus sp. KACC 23026 TaxID=3028315 RepID=UPI0023B0DEDF|nr:spore germination protein [Pullulanibacillus sp. KACC 23026]WEG12256.1 spore germination protein [Pullulanibacillus sp. KACC 23026]
MTIENEIYNSIEKNESELNQTFNNCTDFVIKKIQLSEIPCFVAFFSGLVDTEQLNNFLIRPIMERSQEKQPSPLPHTLRKNKEKHLELMQQLKSERISLEKIMTVHKLREAIQHIADGKVAFFMDECPIALILDIGNSIQRSLEEPKTEVSLRGTYISFIEKLDINIVLIRQIIRSPALKVESMTIGTMTNTPVAMLYLQNVAPDSLIQETKRRLSNVKVDSIQDTGNLAELISDTPYFLFPRLLTTERPDTAASSLLEGKVLILMNGTSKALVAPTNFWAQLQTVDDYYSGVYAAIFMRWMRFFFTMITFLLPGLFVAFTSFHTEMIPTDLALTITASEEQVPFPIVVEVFTMEIMFEVVREATLRMPRMVGQSIGIIGALILGQAAIQAGIVSAPVVIVVSVCGISSFLIPHITINWTFRLLKYPFLLLSSMFGFYGISAGLIALLIHLVNLKSFGQNYMEPLAPFRMSFFRDVIFRIPWGKLKRSPR